MKKYAVIVAGGKGLRMGGEIPKQFLAIKGKPVLMHTMEVFHACDPAIHLIVILPPDQQAYWKQLCQTYRFTLPHRIADGGETRFHSVKNGLELIAEPNALVAVHDGVRPCVAQGVIAECYRAAAEKGAAIPVVDVVETVRRVEKDGTSVTVSRDSYKLVQTPQVFLSSLLKQAYTQPYVPRFTDDASVVESWGHRVALVEGNRENIKLTTPFDLKIAEVLL